MSQLSSMNIGTHNIYHTDQHAVLLKMALSRYFSENDAPTGISVEGSGDKELDDRNFNQE